MSEPDGCSTRVTFTLELEESVRAAPRLILGSTSATKLPYPEPSDTIRAQPFATQPRASIFTLAQITCAAVVCPAPVDRIQRRSPTDVDHNLKAGTKSSPFFFGISRNQARAVETLPNSGTDPMSTGPRRIQRRNHGCPWIAADILGRRRKSMAHRIHLPLRTNSPSLL